MLKLGNFNDHFGYFYLIINNHIKVYENGVVVTVFLDGTEIEYVGN